MTMLDYREVLGISGLASEAGDGLGVKVAVIDTGIPVVDGVPVSLGNNFTHDDEPDSGHATFIGSVLFGDREVIGICPKATSCFCKVFAHGTAKPETVAEAIGYAVNIWKADVINLSLGFYNMGDCNKVLKQACESAILKGVVLVAAAGNDGSKVFWPAAMPGVVSVGAANGKDKAAFSSHGKIDVVAPGEVYGLNAQGYVVKQTGTSFSAALITGLMSLILARRRRKELPVTLQDLKKELIDRCVDLGKKGWDEETGFGLPFPDMGKPSFVKRVGLSLCRVSAIIKTALGKVATYLKHKEDNKNE